jgi:hypothetical protein
MGRVHLFEFGDQKWCPHAVRETTTDFLTGLYKLLNIYEPAYKKVEEVLDKTKVTSIVDCCSGSGGPIRYLRDYLDKAGKKSTVITLTDKYPNIKALSKLEAMYPGSIFAKKEAVEANKMPSSLKGMRTFFSSFHHFSPTQAKQILQDAVDHNAPIGIFECTQRHPRDFIRVLLSPLYVLCLTPFTKKLTLRKFLLTYILPVASLVYAWDYFVSALRTYSTKELTTLINQIDAPGYTWETGKLWSDKAKCYVPYLVGYKI